MKCRASQCERNESEMGEVLGAAECKRHRQDRRVRKERRRGEMDDGANRAVIVRVVCRMSGWILMRGKSFGRDNAGEVAAAAAEVFEVNVSERKDELQRHRCKREPPATPFIGTNPTHQANCPTPTQELIYRAVARAQCDRDESA